jgi:hypothetical protein
VEHLTTFLTPVKDSPLTPSSNGVVNDTNIDDDYVTVENESTLNETLNETAQSSPPVDPRLNDIRKIAQSIFDIASTNKNNAEIYADLYCYLIEKFEIFSVILSDFIRDFKNTIHNINYVDPNVNYDSFCNYIKANDARKSTTMFIVNLMKKQVISKEILIDIIQYFQQIVFQYVNESIKSNETEEIIENIFVFISNSHRDLKSLDEWTTIVENVKKISTMKPANYPGITNRAIFKCLDTLDSLKK